MKRGVVVVLGIFVALAPLLFGSVVHASPAPNATAGTSAGMATSGHRIAYLRPHAVQPAGYASRKPHALGSGNLVWNGGPVQHHPAAYVIFWGAAWATSGHALNPTGMLVQRYFDDVGGSVLGRILTQYHDGSGPIANSATLAAMVIDTAAPAIDATCGGTTIQDSSIQNEIVHVAQTLGWPAPSADATYFVYTPPHTFINDGAGDCSQTLFCAYHAWSTTNPGFAYAAIPYPNDAGCQVTHSPNHNIVGDSLVSTTSHEQFESITDPQVGNGWMDAASYEIADKCVWDFARGYTRLLHGGRFALQAEYSNATRACAFSYTPPSRRR